MVICGSLSFVLDTIINKTTNHHRYYDDYVGTVKVTQENRIGEEIATWTLHDAYPKQIDPIQLDYGTNDAVMTCNATLTYRHFTVVYKNVVKVDEKGEKTYIETKETDMNKTNIMSTLNKQPELTALLRITQTEFDRMYPTLDTMSKSDQNAVLYLYSENNPHGDSMTGGALHTVITNK